MVERVREYWRGTPLASRAGFVLAGLSAVYFGLYAGNAMVWAVRYTVETSSAPAVMAGQMIVYYALAFMGVVAPAVLVALALRSPRPQLRLAGTALAFAAAALGTTLLGLTIAAGALLVKPSLELSMGQLFSAFGLLGVTYVPIALLGARSLRAGAGPSLV